MKLGVCVPYRNREEHMKKFVPHIHKFLNDRGIEHSIYLGHQNDDELFNRGLMKNVAAIAAFEDGCDYIVWHDIDMVPEDESCDYSFPTDNPQHIAVRISQSDYMLKYEEYFGGAVLFSKEQAYKTNGYSNDYWDWGMEDDDLFWRCVLEGMADKQIHQTIENQSFGKFNGVNSFIEILPSNNLRNAISDSHTISVLVKADQQIEKVPIWLIGDTKRQFVEYPIFRKPGYDYGLSFNNSRAYTAMLWDSRKNHIYQWMKRYENQWSWVTMVLDAKNKKMHLYMNGNESDARNGTGTSSPIDFDFPLKRYGVEPFFVGHTPSPGTQTHAKWFKGNIAKIKVWNKAFNNDEVRNSIFGNAFEKTAILNLNFNGMVKDDSYLKHRMVNQNVDIESDNVEVPSTILPYRRDGKFECLPHQTEGIIEEGGIQKWAKGETTAANERRYVLNMQQGSINHKTDGLSNAKERYEFISKEQIMDIPNAFMVNVKTIRK
jgi:hypothetical protein